MDKNFRVRLIVGISMFVVALVALYTFESLEGAKARRLNWRNKVALLYQNITSTGDGSVERIVDAVNNNLNSAEAFSIIDTHELSMDDWKKIDELFGLNLLADSPDIDDEIRGLIDERQKAREAKDYAKSDEIRNVLREKGITVEDTPNGPVWQYI